MENLQDIYVDSNEKSIALLGGSYLRNFLATGSIDKGLCAVTDKRVYFRGKCLNKTGKHYTKSKEERVIGLSDITGTGFIHIKRWLSMLTAIILFIISMSGILLAVSGAGDIFGYLGIFLCVVAVVFAILYFVLKLRVFEISYAGGKIAFKASSYSEEEMQSFQKMVHLAKDNKLLQYQHQ